MYRQGLSRVNHEVLRLLYIVHRDLIAKGGSRAAIRTSGLLFAAFLGHNGLLSVADAVA
jgi:hypothetical protein